MLIEILIFLLLGILAGTFTGLFPGIHINLIGTAIASGTISFLAGVDALYFAVFITAMSIAHVFLDFIPSIFLGAPEDGTELSVLPGHEMLKKGQGFQAVHLTSLGCLYGLFIFLLLIPILYVVSLAVKNLPGMIIALGLIAISFNMILLEEKKFAALLAFLLAGILGFIVLNMGLKEPLLPLLTGLFGSAGLFFSIRQKTKIGKQEKRVRKEKIEKKRALFASAFFAPLSFFLPALSSGQITIIGNQFVKADRKQFLFMLGSVTSLTMCLSFLGLFLIEKTRTGSAAAIKSLIGVLDWKIFLLIVLVMVISGFISYSAVNFLSRKFLVVLEKVDYPKASILTIILISVVTLLISGFLGLFVLAVSTLTGIYCISLGVKRTNMIGCLLVPTIILYLF